MFGPLGHAYVYRSYGRHDCLNIVTEAEDTPSAVFLRAVQPEAGLDVMHRRHGIGRRAPLPNGPGNLCRNCSGRLRVLMHTAFTALLRTG
jgi:DNA-3-methyladenine glycosylase